MAEHLPIVARRNYMGRDTVEAWCATCARYICCEYGWIWFHRVGGPWCKGSGIRVDVGQAVFVSIACRT